MADKTQINLERIRACDAEWEESKHPRSENGQFTSGSGAHVSKIQSGGKAKVQQLKNVSSALAGVNAGIEKADNTFAARMDRTRKAGAAKHKDLEQREDAVRKKYEGDWRYGSMYGKLKNKPGMERLAERVKNKAKSREAQKRDELAGLEKEYHQIQNEYDPIVGERQRAANKQYEKTMRQLYPQKQALEAEQKKFQAAKATLEKGRQQIAATRKLAKAAAAKPAQAAKPTLQKLQQAMHSSSMMGDRAWLHLDGQDYVKIGRDKWEHHPSNSHALGGTYSSQQMMEKIGKAKKVDLYEPSAPAKPQPKAAKNNGGLESYKYKPPSKLEGFPIVMASKKTNSGLGRGNRFKFGFKKYKDGIMIRYVDDYWDSSDYAFVPLKNPTLENAYSYSDNASSKTVSALKDSLVTNEELGKIARQLK
jgi:hypothetical protein